MKKKSKKSRTKKRLINSLLNPPSILNGAIWVFSDGEYVTVKKAVDCKWVTFAHRKNGEKFSQITGGMFGKDGR